MSPDKIISIEREMTAFYDLAIAAECEKSFFLYLYNFVRSLDLHSEINGIFSEIKAERDREYLEVNKLAKIAKKEISKMHILLQDYIVKTENKHPVILNDLSEYNMVLAGEYLSSSGQLTDLYSKTWYPLMILVEEGSADDLAFASKFGDVNKDRRINSWTFSPSYLKRSQLLDGLKIIQEARSWYCWDKIYWAYKAVDDFDNKLSIQLTKEGRLFEAMNWSGLRQEMRQIISGVKSGNDKPYEFLSKDYKYYLSVFFAHVGSVLDHDKLISESKWKGPKTFDDYNLLSGHLQWSSNESNVSISIIIADKTVVFDLAEHTGKTLSYLLKNQKRAVSWSEIYREWTGDEPSEGSHADLKMKIYHNIRAIVKQIASKTGLIDFLIYKSGDVSLNPDYKYSKDLINT